MYKNYYHLIKFMLVTPLVVANYSLQIPPFTFRPNSLVCCQRLQLTLVF